jgi:hypothetical protein
MLFSLVVAVVALSFAVPVLCFIAFRKGYDVGKGKDPELAPGLPALFRQSKADPQVKRFNAILNNIDSYNGGPEGQRMVE